jgi:hypothetical protein
MPTSPQAVELWLSLKALEEYIRDGIVHQMNGAQSFGGEDMLPLRDAYLSCRRLGPFLSPAISTRANAAVEVARVGLNAMLAGMRKAMAAPEALRESRLRYECNRARAETLKSYKCALAEIEPLFGLEKAISTSTSTINISGPVYGQLNVAGSDLHGATLALTLGDLLAKIDASAASETEKAEAKSRLASLLSHPVVAAIAGGLAGSIAA